MRISSKNKVVIDIKSIDKMGVVEIELEPTVKLRSQTKGTFATQKVLFVEAQKNHTSELERVLSNGLDYSAELVRVGAKIEVEPPLEVQPQLDLDKVLNEINSGKLHLRPDGLRAVAAKPRPEVEPQAYEAQPPQINQHRMSLRHPMLKLLAVAGIIATVFIAWKYALALKGGVVQNGSSALSSLEEAKTSLERLDFNQAILNFSNAHSEFTKAGDSLNMMGSFMGNILAAVQGNNQYKSAGNLVEAGQLFSKSGQALVSAVKSISQASSILNSRSDLVSGTRPDLGPNAISGMKKALLESRANIYKANQLLADLDSSIIPEEKRDSFDEFKDKLPEMVNLIDKGVEYSMFLESLIAPDSSKKYLILFQNPSELRPTGGFPGSYGVIHFKDGRLEDFKVDDIYNLDGQLKESIIPPKELQHITPTWAMRDANWFIDFPTSAKKLIQFFKKESGYEVDGIFTFSPMVVKEILKIVGPIELPEYSIILDENNFLAEIQAEVEYGENRVQPKTILVDFAPKLLGKIHSADSDQWLQIFNIFVASLEKKDILMYFKEPALESFVLQENFAGEVKNIPDSDYLYMTISNVKGSKTDIVTDTSLRVDTQLKEGEAIHKVTITRKHNGGKEKYDFYNRTNPSYIRLLVPDNSKFLDISGHSPVNYRPLINYTTAKFDTFIEDPDLKNLESGTNEVKDGVYEYKEAGKKGFGFWVVVEFGKTEVVTLEYKTPINIDNKYGFYIQKQPGLDLGGLDMTFMPPLGKYISGATEKLDKLGNMYKLNAKLDSDLSLILKIGN